MNPLSLFLPLYAGDEEFVMETFSGANVIKVFFSTSERAEVTGISLRMSDGRTLHFQACCGGHFTFFESGLAEA